LLFDNFDEGERSARRPSSIIPGKMMIVA